MIPKYIQLKEKLNNEILEDIYPLGSKLPTEIQLAEKYNVSRSTVRQALGLLQEEGIIDKHWGSGNTIISKSDASKKKIVLILIPSLKNPIYSSMIDDCSSILLKEGYQPEIHETQNQFSLERALLSTMLNDIYGGLIIAPVQTSRPSTNIDLLQMLLKRQTPIVFYEAIPKGIYNACLINTDDYSKGYQIARSFINQGHKKIGGIFLQDSFSSINSFSGFIDAIRDANLPILDNCFLWINSLDFQGTITRSSGSINRFLKSALENVSVVFSDDTTLVTDGAYPLFKSNLTPAKAIGKEVAKTFLSQIKNGNSSSITIPYK